ncbi:ribonuclease HI [Desulfospira joergensenii]|uniref:ribonuclease HI n=1 Tax=Desulfospira joergensenii TaxID=53329 RepID=UPI0003B5BD42|nr:ribonuclease HI [Desulfospira joergensenii]
MKYHIVSTSKTGHGAVFTNLKEALEYQKAHPGSIYHPFDRMPAKIPPIGKEAAEPIRTPGGSSGEITVYTDGSALGNPGPGGWGAVIIQGENEVEEYSQGYRHTTNNRMEMMAVINTLEILKDLRESSVTIHSDSQYTINGITKGWAKGWRKRGWKKADGKPALNPDLWARMLDLVELFPKLKFHWVRGHAGNALNERADDLANGAAGQGRDMLIDEGYVK